MVEIMTREASTVDLNDLVAKLIPESIGREIEKATEGVYPLQNVLIRKVVTLRAPKTDLNKLLEIHGGADVAAASSSADLGKAVARS
jgi:small subunit ribosomal protein S3Ae